MTVHSEAESQRILAEYERRDRELPADYYGLHRWPNLFMHHEHERLLLKCLHRCGQIPLTGRRILEVGCGEGNWLQVFERLGASRTNLAGIELGPDRVETARHRLPGAEILAADAAVLPWPDQTFDVVFQRMMFTSILDAEVRRRAAAEIMRVLKPGGVMIWVDFFINPRNPHVRPLGRGDVRALFPGWNAKLFRTTLAPPLTRRLAPLCWSAARALESLKLFNTFFFGYLTKPGQPH
jgi:SAM-dependent methyltransferase